MACSGAMGSPSASRRTIAAIMPASGLSSSTTGASDDSATLTPESSIARIGYVRARNGSGRSFRKFRPRLWMIFGCGTAISRERRCAAKLGGIGQTEVLNPMRQPAWMRPETHEDVEHLTDRHIANGVRRNAQPAECVSRHKSWSSSWSKRSTPLCAAWR